MKLAGSLAATLTTLVATCWAGQQLSPQQVVTATIDPRTVRLPVVERSDIRFVRLRRSQGLSQQRVTTIAQDERGFMWFGTQFGADRYDGYHFTLFKNDPDNPASPCGVIISSLLNDRSGRLWIGCDYALDRYDPISETFVHYRLAPSKSSRAAGSVRHISQDQAGSLWLSTGDGLYRVDPITGARARFGHDNANPFSLSSDDVRSSGEDREGTFWVATSEGLDAFDRQRARVTEHVPLSESRDFSFYEDREGDFWLLYASGNGLAVLDRKTHHLTRYSFGREDLPTHPLTGVSSMLEDRDGNLWIGTFSDGLLRLDPRTQTFSRYRSDPSKGDSLTENRITTLFEDREGDIWLGFGATEPAFFATRPPPFEALPFDPANPDNLGEPLINKIYQDRAGIVWMGTTGALVRFDRGNRQLTQIAIPGGGVASDVLCMVEDPSGALWIGTSGQGLYRRSQTTGRLTAFRHRDTDTTSLSNDTVFHALVDHTGTLWLATADGLDRFNAATEDFTTFREVKRGESSGLDAFVEDPSGALWVGTYNLGVLRFDPHTGRFASLSNPQTRDLPDHSRINGLMIDHTGALWAATQNGVNRYDRQTQRVTYFSERDGLASNDVSCILEDSSGGLWMSTSRGLSYLDPARKSFSNYSQADGLPGPDLTGYSACFRGADGEMFFGGFSGAVAFRPEMLPRTAYTPPVVLTSFQLFGKPVGLAPGSPLKRAIDYTDQLTLSHEQNSFSFEFSALSFRSPETNRYRFKLEGLDKNWHEVGSDRRYASYTTLPAGGYRFRVQGATIRGPWSEPGVAVQVTIEPAWWETWWLRALAGICILLAIAGLYALRVRQLHRQFDIRLQARDSERARIARELHDTLLQNFQGLLLRFQTVLALCETRPAEAKQVLRSSIDQTAQAITDGREAVQGLRASTVERNDLAEAITTLGEQLAADASSAAGLHVEVQGTPRNLHPIVRDEIYRVASEALRNAFRHAEAQQIEVEFRYDARQLQLRIRDDGKGIDPAFLTAEGHAGHFGLHGMRERAKVLGGKLTVWTAAESGAEIELIVPASRAYAAPRRRSWFAEKFSGNSVQSES